MPGWRWCAAATARAGFVRRADGSAFPVRRRPMRRALPSELALALAQAGTGGTPPSKSRVEPHVARRHPRPLAARGRRRVRRGDAVALALSAPAAAFAGAIDLLQAGRSRDRTPRKRPRAAVRARLRLAAAALALHVVATAGEWTWLRLDGWHNARNGARSPPVPGCHPTPRRRPRRAAPRSRAVMPNSGTRTAARAGRRAAPARARCSRACARCPRARVKSAIVCGWPLDARSRARRPGRIAELERACGRPACRRSRDVGDGRARSVSERNDGRARSSLRRPANRALVVRESAARAPIVAALCSSSLVALLRGGALATVTRDIAAMRAAQGAGRGTRRRAADEPTRWPDSRAPLRRAPTPIRARLERVLVAAWPRGAVTHLDWKDGRAHLVFGAVGFDALIAGARSTAARRAASGRRSYVHRARGARDRPRRARLAR